MEMQMAEAEVRNKLLMKDDLNHIFKYVVEKYGKDYIRLYE
jgi:hypothetical protein